MMTWAERNHGIAYLGILSLLITLQCFGLRASDPSMLVVLVLGVMLLGLPHGALDPLVAMATFDRSTWFTRTRFAVAYALVVIMTAVVWWLAPFFGLASFLAIAAVHFGSDWEGQSTLIGRTSYGLSVVALPSVFHGDAVGRIYHQVCGGGVDLQPIQELIAISKILAIVAALVAVVSSIRLSRQKPEYVLEFAGIVVSGLILPPLLYFACFFCLLHSPRHLLGTARSVGLSHVSQVIRACASITMVAVIAGVISWHFLPSVTTSTRTLQVIFVGLSALTIPHMLTEFIAKKVTQRTEALELWRPPSSAKTT